MSVIQYFGIKSNLFREAVHWTIPVDESTGTNPAETAENYLRGLLAGGDARMAVLLRNSMTSQDALDLLREKVTDQAVASVAAATDAPDARLRAALLSAVLMGIASQRYLLRLPDLAAASDDEIVALIAPLLTALISPKSSPAV